jgi:hypothetical protein
MFGQLAGLPGAAGACVFGAVLESLDPESDCVELELDELSV